MTDLTEVVRVLGIDPGKTTAFCTIEVRPAVNQWRLIERVEFAGCDEVDGLHEMYCQLHVRLHREARWTGIAAAAMEQLMAYVNTAQEKAEAQGVIRLATFEEGIPMFRYAPVSVRAGVIGHGRAKASDVAKVTRELTGLLNARPKFTVHQQDALAVALYHALQAGYLQTIEPQEEGAE